MISKQQNEYTISKHDSEFFYRYRLSKRNGAVFSRPVVLVVLFERQSFKRATDHAFDFCFCVLFRLVAVVFKNTIAIDDIECPLRAIFVDIHDTVDEAVVVFVLIHLAHFRFALSSLVPSPFR